MLDCVVLLFRTSQLFNIENIIFYVAYVSPKKSSLYDNLEEKDGIIKIQNEC